MGFAANPGVNWNVLTVCTFVASVCTVPVLNIKMPSFSRALNPSPFMVTKLFLTLTYTHLLNIALHKFSFSYCICSSPGNYKPWGMFSKCCSSTWFWFLPCPSWFRNSLVHGKSNAPRSNEFKWPWLWRTLTLFTTITWFKKKRGNKHTEFAIDIFKVCRV